MTADLKNKNNKNSKSTSCLCVGWNQIVPSNLEYCFLHANDIEFVGKTIAKDTQNNNSASKYDMLINGGKSSNLLGFNWINTY